MRLELVRISIIVTFYLNFDRAFRIYEMADPAALLSQLGCYFFQFHDLHLFENLQNIHYNQPNLKSAQN